MRRNLAYQLITLIILFVSTLQAQVLDTMMMDFYSNQLRVNGRKIYPVVKEAYSGEVKTTLLEISLPNSMAWRREERARKSYHKKDLAPICLTAIQRVDLAIRVVLDTSIHNNYQWMFIRQNVNGIPDLIPVCQPYVDVSILKKSTKEELYHRLAYFGYLEHRRGRKMKFNRKFEAALMAFSSHFIYPAGYPIVHLEAIEVLLDGRIN